MALQLLFLTALLLPSYAVIVYYLAMVLARFCGVQDMQPAATNPRHSFMIVIPAHDEQLVIERTIRSCLMADYPRSLFDITVIADNCGDNTATLAKRLGTNVLIRNDPQHPGKGYALAWAFDQLMSRPHDAFMVLDADCPLGRNALAVLDTFLQNGDYVLQANHLVSNPDVSPISYAASVGRTLEYDLFFAPKSRLGLAVLLVGTGMVFHRSILENLGWSSHSCAEDTEFTIELARQGQRIRFVANAYVRCASVETDNELRVQRTRWASGNLSLGRSDSLRLIWEGITQRNLRTIDLGWTLLIISRPLVLLHLSAVQLGAVILLYLHPDTVSLNLAGAALFLLPLYGIYLCSGIWMLGLSSQRMRHLVQAPIVLARLALISFAALMGFRNPSWNRTPRR